MQQGPEAITRLWGFVIDRELAGISDSEPVKFMQEEDLAAMDLNVLVVEDQAFQQQAINALLQIYSTRNPAVCFRTTIVDSAVSAMSMLQRRRDFHIVILDVILPGVHGDQLLPRIRQLLGEHVAVVMVSALGEVSLVQRCIFSGADSFMVKPLQIASVSQLWQQCMAKNRALLPSPSPAASSFMGSIYSTPAIDESWKTAPSPSRGSSPPTPGAAPRGSGPPTPSSAMTPTRQATPMKKW